MNRQQLTFLAFVCVLMAYPTIVAAQETNCPPPIDFELDAAGDDLMAGDVVDGVAGALGIGITVTTDDPAHPAMIYDSACLPSGAPSGCSGGDKDLGTPNQDFGGPGVGTGGEAGKPGQNALPLGNVLIISEDGFSGDPDDNSCGGTLIFTFESEVFVDRVQVIDIDEGHAGAVTAFDASGSVVLASAMLDNRGNNSVQTVQLGVGDVRRLEVYLPGSGAVSEIVFCDESACVPEVDFEGLDAGTVIDGVAGAIAQVTVTTGSAGNPAMIFDSANPTGGDDDLGTPNIFFGGPGLGDGGGPGAGANETEQDKILIISEDGNTAVPDDNAGGGTLTFTFDDPTFVVGLEILDIDDNETCGTVTALDEGGVEIASLPLANLGDNSFQSLGLGIGAVKKLEVYLQGSGAVARILSCDDDTDCNPSAGNLKIKDGKKVIRLKLTNDGADPVTIDSVDVTWAPLAGDLRKIKLGSTVLFDGNDDPLSASITLTGPEIDRTLLPGESKTLKAIFQRGVDASKFHSLAANFAEALDCASSGHNGGGPLDDCDLQPQLLELVPKNKQARGAVINAGAETATLDSIMLNEWSSVNGNLKKIKLGADVIWTGDLDPSGVIYTLGAGDFTGAPALRIFAPGDKKTLRFIFANDAQDGPYDIMVWFSAASATCDVLVDQEGTPGVCGDGTQDPGEECDDGNNVDGDGCSAVCTDECGNGVLDGVEECDDGNNVDGDGCSAVCTDECGNGVLDGVEECDDGNNVDGDGCSAVCEIEDTEPDCPCLVPGNWPAGAGSVWPALAGGLGVTGCTPISPSFLISEGVGDEGASVAATVGDATDFVGGGGVPVCQVYIDDPTFSSPFEVTGLSAEQVTACVAALAAGCP